MKENFEKGFANIGVGGMTKLLFFGGLEKWYWINYFGTLWSCLLIFKIPRLCRLYSVWKLSKIVLDLIVEFENIWDFFWAILEHKWRFLWGLNVWIENWSANVIIKIDKFTHVSMEKKTFNGSTPFLTWAFLLLDTFLWHYHEPLLKIMTWLLSRLTIQF